ncbi:hypothetical protein QJS10_CPB11g00914 [Acorus calamus]|uniref:Uncharacterized protein n=1 Tax=Acorus calamus TaxID=4465 RepID=A0AAV9DQE9_ACOCL|nr:hypothetical protein QJS10_CPB11g00914 [Acorus calamus]
MRFMWIFRAHLRVPKPLWLGCKLKKARFSLALHRLTSPAGMLYSDQINQHGHVKVKAA